MNRIEQERIGLQIMYQLGQILDEEDNIYIEGMFFKKDYPEGVITKDYLHLFIEYDNQDTIADKIKKIKNIDAYSHMCCYPEMHNIQLCFNL